MGNSIGLALHEPPYIVPGIQQSVREDMVFSIYPTGFVPGTGTVKMADVVLITEDGCKNFTSLARETV
jgi:Xaa-Pro aminopeptidase